MRCKLTLMKHVLGNNCSSIIKQLLIILPLQFTWKEKWREDIRTSVRELVPISFKDPLPQVTFSNKNLSKEDLEELQSFSFILSTWEWQGLGTQLTKQQKGAIPAPAVGLAPQSPAEMRALL